MNIFESLKTLNVSEACLNDILSLVEEEVKKKIYKSGLSDKKIDSMLSQREQRTNILGLTKKGQKLANREYRRARQLAAISKARNDGDTNIGGLKNALTALQGAVTIQKGRVNNDPSQELRGFQQKGEIIKGSPVMQRNIDRLSKELKGVNS